MRFGKTITLLVMSLAMLAQPATADMIKLTCRPTGAWATNHEPLFLEIDAEKGVLYHVMADGTPVGGVTVVDGKPVGQAEKFDKSSDFIQWGEPNGDTTNFFSVDRVSGDMKFDAPADLNGNRSVETLHCEKPGASRAF